MKAVEEIGQKKLVKFILYSMLMVIYHGIINHFLYFSPFRKYFLIILGAKIGKDSIIMDAKFVNWHQKGPGGLTIKSNCFVSDGVMIDLYDSVKLGDNVTLAQRVLVLTHTNVGYKDHPLQKYFPKSSKPVIFKNGSFIGANSTILPGVIIGENSFVAAGSVVAKDVPDNVLVAGVPAKIIRTLK